MNKCSICKEVEIQGVGMCSSCGLEYWRNHDENYPFIVRFGNDLQEFKTEKEAQEFVAELHSSYVERKD